MASKLGSSPGPLAPHIERYHYENGQETNDEASSWQKANDEANQKGQIIMPMVGKKEFAYTAKGKAAAKKEAKKTGKPMKKAKNY